VIGDVVIGGLGRNILEAAVYGDRLIDGNGNYSLFLTCAVQYGGDQIIRAMRPSLQSFEQQQSAADGALNASDPTSSGGQEVAIVYPGSGNHGQAYPGTPGHNYCPLGHGPLHARIPSPVPLPARVRRPGAARSWPLLNFGP